MSERCERIDKYSAVANAAAERRGVLMSALRERVNGYSVRSEVCSTSELRERVNGYSAVANAAAERSEVYS